MSAAPPSTAPTNSSTVRGFKPSVIMRDLLDRGGTRAPKRGALFADEATGPAATPVPGAPVAVRVVAPALEQRGGRAAAVFDRKLRQRVEQRRHGVRAQRRRVRHVEPPFHRGPRQIRAYDESIRIQHVQAGEYRQ